jgi:hypothetical protein
MKDPLYVLARLVLFDTVADEFRGDSFLTQTIVLWVRDNYRRVLFGNFRGPSPFCTNRVRFLTNAVITYAM